MEIYGSFLNLGYLEEGFSFPYLSNPKLIAALFSTDFGLLSWSPILIFALFGLYLIIKTDFNFGIVLTIVFISHLYLTSSYIHYDQGDSFGNRMLINITPIFGLGLMKFYEKFLKIKNYLFLSISISLTIINLCIIPLYCFRIIGNPY